VGEGNTVEASVVEFRSMIQERLRSRIREAIAITVEEELAEALGCGPYERNGSRRGYRHGTYRRQITTAQGSFELELPRGRLIGEDGGSEEFRTAIVPRYQRRTEEVDEAILSVYLAGANSRRIRKALAPLLGEANLSKSAISRVVGRVKALFETWHAPHRRLPASLHDHRPTGAPGRIDGKIKRQCAELRQTIFYKLRDTSRGRPCALNQTPSVRNRDSRLEPGHRRPRAAPSP
jgi:hypothetical protein